ncbi:hypothetical protein KR100_03855 [Synechococcus sp. KORDI-100]|uniref:acyl-CoA thioesterase n=1 Tax=Synechococcus sp. KORDI-100 TaxID=1280380 RepID=UPI0004E050E7|nr:acyl-CoA thioesterase [Synechococcus sp. KORDI-100]AII42505.1 hypothetical protein KR100_03855 [Synechococcus sp. KORDI-100]
MNSKLRESVTPNPWRLSKRVLPQHTDHAGVVWHGTYVAWLEEARVEALALAGAQYGEIAAGGIEMPVVSLQIDYRRSLRHGDIIDIESVCGSQRGVRWPWSFRLMCNRDLVAEAAVDLVMLAAEGRVLRRPPPELIAVMQRLILGPAGEPID